MNFLFITKKKITVEADLLRKLLQEKAEKIQAQTPEPHCHDLVHMQVNNHSEACFSESEVFYGKRLAASYEGMTMVEMFKPLYPNERRNKQHRNKLTQAEEETLHQTRNEIRTMQVKPN